MPKPEFTLAVIPARGGSKRIPRKNIKLFHGKPLITWSIAAAQASQVFDKIIVSTDDAEIAAVAQKYGAEVPFLRPQQLADDYTGTSAVTQHAIHWAQEEGLNPTQVCCIYATAPFLQAQDLRAAQQQLKEQQCSYVFSATSFPFPIQRAIKITATGRTAMFQPEFAATRSQDLEEAYHDAGQFYWGTTQAWLNNEAVFSQGSIPYILPRHLVQDIDTPEDWLRAELMFQAVLASQELA